MQQLCTPASIQRGVLRGDGVSLSKVSSCPERLGELNNWDDNNWDDDNWDDDNWDDNNWDDNNSGMNYF